MIDEDRIMSFVSFINDNMVHEGPQRSALAERVRKIYLRFISAMTNAESVSPGFAPMLVSLISTFNPSEEFKDIAEDIQTGGHGHKNSLENNPELVAWIHENLESKVTSPVPAIPESLRTGGGAHQKLELPALPPLLYNLSKLKDRDDYQSRLLAIILEDIDNKKWPRLREVMTLKDGFAPSQKTVDAALEKLGTERNWYPIQEILRTAGSNKPSSEGVGRVLLQATHFRIKEFSEALYNLLEEILQMTGENKPSQETIGMVLEIGFGDDANKRLKLIKSILLMEGDNKPSKLQVRKLFRDTLVRLSVPDILLSKDEKKDLNDIISEILNMSGDNKPSPQSLNYLISKILENLGDEKPSPELLSLYTTLKDQTSKGSAKSHLSESQPWLNLFFEEYDQPSVSPHPFFDQKKPLTLSEIYEESQKEGSRTRAVFIELLWLNKTGELTELAPEEITLYSLEQKKPRAL